MAAFSKLKPGMTVWFLRRENAGNTTMKRTALHSMRIISVDEEKSTVTASWNGNRERVYQQRDYKKWKVKKPEPKRIGVLGPIY